MYSGTNPSALRSREWLRSALLQLLEKEKYTQITIKDICQQADLSRQTFYQIFDSKEEVMEYHFQTLFQEFAEECGSFQDISIIQVSYHFFYFFHRHKDFVDVLISNKLAFLLEQQFEIYLEQIASFQSHRQQDAHGDYTTAYMAGALTQILVHWFRKGCDLSVLELSRITEYIITGRVFRQ